MTHIIHCLSSGKVSNGFEAVCLQYINDKCICQHFYRMTLIRSKTKLTVLINQNRNHLFHLILQSRMTIFLLRNTKGDFFLNKLWPLFSILWKWILKYSQIWDSKMHHKSVIKVHKNFYEVFIKPSDNFEWGTGWQWNQV